MRHLRGGGRCDGAVKTFVQAKFRLGRAGDARGGWTANLEDDLEEEGGDGEGDGGVAAAELLTVTRLAGAGHAQESLRVKCDMVRWKISTLSAIPPSLSLPVIC